MAQQITVDIVAETKKLTSGINDANNQIEGMNGKLKGVAAAAGAAASSFLLTKGVTFLQQGIEEAKDAREAMNNAESAFGKGSTALQKITEDAEKFGKALGIDNDDIIKLSTSLGSRLPEDAKLLSAELVNLAKDVEAVSGGALTAEAVTGKLAKAFSDGEISAKELTKIFPGLEKATYDQAEALSKAGDNQGALTLLIDAGQKKFGDAAEKNVTSAQKFETALADLKEQIGTKILPFVEKFVDFLTKVITAFDNLPGPVKNFITIAGILLVTGALVLTFLASTVTALTTLGIIGGTAGTGIGLATIALNLLKIAMAGIGIGLLIAAIVLLVQNWDTVTAVVGKVWEAIKNFGVNAWNVIKDFVGKVLEAFKVPFNWIKDNWPLILGILTGPIGLAIVAIVKNFDAIKSKASEIIEFVKNLFLKLPDTMVTVGKNIVTGLWNGIQGMASWLKDKVTGFFKNLVPSWAEKALGISSPSKVFAAVGKNIVQGLGSTFNTQTVKAVTTRAAAGISVPTASLPSLMSGRSAAAINVTINAGLGTDPYALGREVNSALTKYGRVSSRVARG